MPDFKLDETSGLPVWVQLRNRFIYLIKTGYYQPGDQLPSVRSLAAEISINYNTVSKAYMGLERDGYVTTVRGSGVFVREQNDLPQEDSHVNSLVEDFVENCLKEGMTYDDIPKLVSKYIRKVKRGNEEKRQ